MENGRLRWLLAARLALGVVASVLAPVELRSSWTRRTLPPSGLDHILIVPLLALALCQTLLLAIWVSASKVSSWKRLAGLVAGAVYLEALFLPLPMQEFLGLNAVTVVVTTVSLLAGRAIGIRLTRKGGADQAAPPEREGLRFSIRGLMLFTAAVALLSAGGRLLQSAPAHFLILVGVWSLCFVAVGLVALWAALGTARPLRRVPVVFALSPTLGAVFVYAAKAHQAGCFYITLTMLVYSAALIGSLLVVRACGYRLVGRARPSPDIPPVGMEGVEPSPLVRPTGGAAFPG